MKTTTLTLVFLFASLFQIQAQQHVVSRGSASQSGSGSYSRPVVSQQSGSYSAPVQNTVVVSSGQATSSGVRVSRNQAVAISNAYSRTHHGQPAKSDIEEMHVVHFYGDVSRGDTNMVDPGTGTRPDP